MTSKLKDLGDTGAELIELIRAADFAARKHATQRRKGNDDPYINHPIGVARIIAEEGLCGDLVTLQAALLHDTVEDTETTPSELQQEFGSAVNGVVSEVTDDKSLHRAKRKRLQIKHAKNASASAQMVKYADKLYNCRSLEGKSIPHDWSVERVQGYIAWSAAVLHECRGAEATFGISGAPLEVAWGKFIAGDFVDRDGVSHPRIPMEARKNKKALNAFVEQYVRSLEDD